MARALGEWLPAIVVFVVVVGIWEVSLLALNVQSFLVPRPSVIAGSLASEWGTLGRGLIYTGGEAVGGLVIGVVIGTVIGMATARWVTARELLLPVAIGASTIPIIAFAPITKNWFGYDNPVSRMTIVALMVFFPVMVNTIRGLTNVDPAAIELMRSYAAGEGRVVRSLRIPNALPYWFTALRIATTLSVIGAVVGEFFGGPLYSLGIYITLETGHSRYPTAWAGIVVACALGIVLYLIVVAVEWLTIPWRLARERSA
ncbi:MAG TPA: ABC transporter permease [Candidatus Limnocylindrales bacterium]|nr:ABC transporter permease [Candidatus Limnocylindrales bacterium]